MLRDAEQRDVGPRGAARPTGSSDDEQNGGRDGDESTVDRQDEQRAPDAADAGRFEFGGRAGQAVAAADRRQGVAKREEQAEQQADGDARGCVPEPLKARNGRAADANADGVARTAETAHTQDDEDDADGGPCAGDRAVDIGGIAQAGSRPRKADQ